MGKKIYGIIEQNENVFFVLNGFQCAFINNLNEVSRRKTLLNHKFGFILGRVIGETISNQYIYIYTDKDIEIYEKTVLNTWLYLISSRPSLESYSGIRFKGGILKKLFFPDQWGMEYCEDNSMSVKFTDSRKTYSLNNEKLKGSISIGTGIGRNRSLEEGSSISTTAPELELLFENVKELDSVPDNLTYILNLCQFMAFRKNVRFDEINLVNPDPNLPRSFAKIANCYFRFDEPYEISKSNLRCITFNALGECIGNLLSCIVVYDKSQNLIFNTNFIPETDKEVNKISSMRIREIFSALEAELYINNVKCQNSIEFDNLIYKMKQVVKEHQRGENPLDDVKDYDYIYGSLDQMAGSLANRIYIFLQENKNLIKENLSKEQIETLVKYRNTITHGGFIILDIEKGMTAITLIRLIYCSILKRIGMEDEKIEKLFDRNILS